MSWTIPSIWRLPTSASSARSRSPENGSTARHAAAKAGIDVPVSPHWLRHAHGSHAIDRGGTVPEVQNTLGHDNIATTSGYLHARPDSSSGLKLDPGVFLRWRSGLNNRLQLAEQECVRPTKSLKQIPMRWGLYQCCGARGFYSWCCPD